MLYYYYILWAASTLHLPRKNVSFRDPEKKQRADIYSSRLDSRWCEEGREGGREGEGPVQKRT